MQQSYYVNFTELKMDGTLHNESAPFISNWGGSQTTGIESLRSCNLYDNLWKQLSHNDQTSQTHRFLVRILYKSLHL